MQSISTEHIEDILPWFIQVLFGEISMSSLKDIKENLDSIENIKLIHKFSDIPSRILAGYQGDREFLTSSF